LEDNLTLDPSGFISIKNKPTIDEQKKFYSQLYFQDEKSRPKSYQDTYDQQERKHIALMNQLCLYAITKVRNEWKTKPGSMLEVGVGEGFLISYAQACGWDVTGIDFTNFGLAKFNPHVIDKITIGNAFDVLEDFERQHKRFNVCMIHNVLEHVINPRELLNSLRNLSTDNGIIVITVPNDFSEVQLKAYELGIIKKKFWINPQHHLHYFNTTNIRKFMEEMNFRIVDMYSTFPIDFFLFHPGSNYIKKSKNGKPAHRARIELDLIMAQAGLENYHKLLQSFSSCNVGRDFTILLEK
jgi:2-polyprenyl-3-methyl-5-hydroxy-6-metoxy-1,4-benzoquinol methylase